MAVRLWKRRAPRRNSAQADSYHAVEVVGDEHPCAAAKRLEGKRILSRFIHLFPLPLPECDAHPCRCTYKHYADRRGDDRRLPYASPAKTERRSGVNRRADRGFDWPTDDDDPLPQDRRGR